MGWVRLMGNDGRVIFEAGGKKGQISEPSHYEDQGNESVPVGPFIQSETVMRDDDYYFEVQKVAKKGSDDENK